MARGNWRLVLCGINHQTSTVEQRERLSFGHDAIAKAQASFGECEEVLEATIVSTCNRVEFYFLTGRTTDPFEVVRAFYADTYGLDIAPLNDRFYLKNGREAVEHLFRVAGGLDSMVLGENQILGQVKDAYSSACAVKAAGRVIHRLFHQAFRVGKQIRADTEMGKGACSVSSAAMELLRTRLDRIEDPCVLFIGVNQMIALAASNLSREHHGPFLFANRTPEKAVALAGRYEGEGCGLDDLPSLVSQADVVITCTGSEQPLISSPVMAAAMAKDPGRKLVIMDMAVPRDVEFEQNGFPGVEVYDLQDVQAHVEDQQQRRAAAIPQAEEIVARRTDEFFYWYDHVRRQPTPRGIEALFESARQAELAEIRKDLPADVRDQLDDATRRLVKRLIRETAKTCSKCSKSE